MTLAQPSLILLVEDSDDDLAFIMRAFKRAEVRAEVEVLRDGEAAIRWLSERLDQSPAAHLPSVILLDLKLPRRSGLEVLAWIKNQSGLTGTPVCILTSSDEPRDISQAYALGANSYLLKPGGPEGLTELVRAVSEYWCGLNRLLHRRRDQK